jgi:hypothetical protein
MLEDALDAPETATGEDGRLRAGLTRLVDGRGWNDDGIFRRLGGNGTKAERKSGGCKKRGKDLA